MKEDKFHPVGRICGNVNMQSNRRLFLAVQQTPIVSCDVIIGANVFVFSLVWIVACFRVLGWMLCLCCWHVVSCWTRRTETSSWTIPRTSSTMKWWRCSLISYVVFLTHSARGVKLCTGRHTAPSMCLMNRPAEVLLQGLQCTEYAIWIGHVNTSLALNVLTADGSIEAWVVNFFKMLWGTLDDSRAVT